MQQRLQLQILCLWSKSNNLQGIYLCKDELFLEDSSDLIHILTLAIMFLQLLQGKQIQLGNLCNLQR